jgi:DNA primase
MPRIAQETVEQVAAASDIVEVIGGYFPLKRAGTEFRALCPFHQEKTPSFYVNPAKQSYYCHGCGAGGAVFQFLMQYENVDFPEAVRRLSSRAGIPILETEFSAEPNSVRKKTQART